MLAWVIVLLAFFVLSVQLFITIIEFKLTVLAGFVLVPFALFGQTAFLAERVLGNVISSGIKLMVLAIVVGIGSSIFGTIMRPTGEVTLTQAARPPWAACSGCRVRMGLAAGLGPAHAARRRRSRRHHAAPVDRHCRRHAMPAALALRSRVGATIKAARSPAGSVPRTRRVEPAASRCSP